MLRTRTWPLAGLLLGLAALGCQPAGLSPAPPAGVRLAGTLELTAASDAAVTVEGACGAYALQGLDPRITLFRLTVTGPTLAVPIVVEAGPDDFGDGCQLVVPFDDLLPGTYHVALDARDAGGYAVSTDEGDVTVVADGGVARLTLRCKPVPSPSPTETPPPSISPSTSPLPSFIPVSPTPDACQVAGVAYPAASVPDPSAHFERIHGLNADVLGRVYLLGLKPSPWPSDGIQVGRTVRVDQAGTQTPLTASSALWQSSWPMFEMEIDQPGLVCRLSPFFGFSGAPQKPARLGPSAPPQSMNWTVARPENGAQQANYFDLPFAGDFLGPWGASASMSGSFWLAPGSRDAAKLPAYAIYSSSMLVPMVDRRHLTGDRSDALERPLSLIHDRRRNAPIWTSKRGILTPAVAAFSGVTNKAAPRVLVDRPAYGITRVAGFSSARADFVNHALFTTYQAGNHDVYFADLDAHQATPATNADLHVAFRFDTGIPHRIERGPDGRFYVLLQEGPLPSDAASGHDPYFYERPGSNHVRVVQLRYDAATRRLWDPRLVADSFTDPTPSF